MIFTYFLLFHRLPLHSVVSVIWCIEVFILMYSNLIFLFCLSIWCHIQDIIIKSNILKLFPYVFFWEFCVLCVFDPFWLTFQSIYFSLIFGIRCQVRVQFYSFACENPVFLAPFIERSEYPSLTEWSWHACWKLFDHVCEYLFLGSLFLLFWSIYFSLCQYTLFWLLYFSISFEVRNCETSVFVLSPVFCNVNIFHLVSLKMSNR